MYVTRPREGRNCARRDGRGAKMLSVCFMFVYKAHESSAFDAQKVDRTARMMAR